MILLFLLLPRRNKNQRYRKKIHLLLVLIIPEMGKSNKEKVLQKRSGSVTYV